MEDWINQSLFQAESHRTNNKENANTENRTEQTHRRIQVKTKLRLKIIYYCIHYCSLLIKFLTLCVFEPPFGGLGTTYDVYLGLIGKRVVDFLLVLIELFSLGVTAESLRAKRDRKSAISLQRGQFDAKFQIQGVAPTNHFLHG